MMSTTFWKILRRGSAQAILLAAMTSPALAQTVTYSEDFQSLATQVNPPGWVDSAVGTPAPDADGLFKTWPDPTQGNRGANVVFGSKSASGKPGQTPRIGRFSTLTTHSFNAEGRFELRGRFIRTHRDARVGFTVLSSYPDADSYYMVGLWDAADALTMQLFAADDRVLDGRTDSGFTPEINRWYRLLIRVDDISGSTRVQAKFWPDGEQEPEVFTIDARDQSAARLIDGRIGIWSAVRGEVYVDELFAKSPIDFTAPVISFFDGGDVLPSGVHRNRVVTPIIMAVDDIDPSPDFVALLNGEAFTSGTAVDSEGNYLLHVMATDDAGNSSEAQVAFTIDRTPPIITIVTPTAGALFTQGPVEVTGTIDDAESVRINGRDAVRDLETGTWTIALPVGEGAIRLEAIGADRAGNIGRASVNVAIDSRNPLLRVISPASGACLNTAVVNVDGQIVEPHLDRLTVTTGGAIVAATVTPDGTWTAPVSGLGEGEHHLTVEAVDRLGHRAVALVRIRVDRTAPVITVTTGDSMLTPGAVFGRSIAPLIRIDDLDPSPGTTLTLDGQPYTRGAVIDGDGPHTLVVSARDCAGHVSSSIYTFTIDSDAPQFEDFTPASGSILRDIPPAIAGRVSDDTAVVRLRGTAQTVQPASDGSFSIGDLEWRDGTNSFTFEAEDRAGHTSESTWKGVLDRDAPTVLITIDGTPLEEGAVFNRAVSPVFGSDDTAATLTATLNGATFTPGSSVSSDGAHQLVAVATDKAGNRGEMRRSFSLDRSAPTLTIDAPAAGFSTEEELISISGSATNATRVRVQGREIPLSGSRFGTSVTLEYGENGIVVEATSASGASAQAVVTGTRVHPTGIVITHPLDGLLTNRARTRVTGMVFDSSSAAAVTVAGQAITPDVSGAFVLHELPLQEGENVITASVTRNGATRTAQVRVRADRTPPTAVLLADGSPLADDSAFPSATVLSVTSSDESQPVGVRLLVDGAESDAPTTVTANGMHRIQLVARDAAGNETWVERSFRVGESGTSGCSLTGLDPADGATITTTTVFLTGRTGGSRVSVNGVEASIRNGTFLASVELEREGANAIRVACVDTGGNEIETADLTLHRSTGLPTLVILEPSELDTTAEERVPVTLRAGGGAVGVVVNGVARALDGDPATERQITISDVPLSSGLNVISASASDAAGRSVSVTRRVLRRAAPGSVSIVTPLPNIVVGGSSVRAAGLWRDIDPASLRVSLDGAVATPLVTSYSDTSGHWSLEQPVSAGTRTLRVEARSWNGLLVQAEATFEVSGSAPAIRIETPAAITWLPATSADTSVGGAIEPAEGARVDVNGSSAALTGERFLGSTELRTGSNMIIARATSAEGRESADSVLVHRLPIFEVREMFPADGSTAVDPATVLLILLSSPVDASSTAAAVQLSDAAGAAVPVVTRVDRDTIAIAPTTTLRSGERYTLAITSGLRDLAGQSLTQSATSAFSVLGAAPATAPLLDLVASVCGQAPVLTGTTAPGARLKIVTGGLQLSAVADASGRFTATLPGVGEGWQVVRVTASGSDGSMSPTAETSFVIDCAPLGVRSASFDRSAGVITLLFSKDIERATIASAITVSAGGAAVTWTERSFSGESLELAVPAGLEQTVSLRIATTLTATDGSRLPSEFERTFAAGDEEQPRAGRGWIRGEVFDASTGRPLPGVRIVVGRSAVAFNDRNNRLASLQSGGVVGGEAVSDARGRYSVVVDEGPWTLHLTRDEYTPAWRAVVAPAGAGTQPIDVRLARSAPAVPQQTGAVVSDDAAGDAIRIELEIGAAAGSTLSVSALPLQSLPGLLPLGWSPVAAAWVEADTLSVSTLLWSVQDEAILAGTREPVLVRFAPERNEWITVGLAHERRDGSRLATPIDRTGGWALALADLAPRVVPPAAAVGAPLLGVPASTEVVAPAALRVALDPPVILPTQSSLASLEVDTTAEALFPSGTAVEAQVDEVLMLADGGVVTDLPFATDVLLYHSADGAAARASFRLAPSDRAREVMLREGAEHVRIVPYAGRVDRGTTVGPEGGAVAGSPELVVEIPAGALDRNTRASVVPLNDAAGAYPLHGYVVHRGFELRLEDANAVSSEEGDSAAPRLFRAARLVTSLDDATTQPLLVRIEQLPNGGGSSSADLATLAARMSEIEAGRFTTMDVAADALALSGIDREGRYLVVSPRSSVAFAAGSVVTTTSQPLAGAVIDTPFLDGVPMGVVSLSDASGGIALPVRSGDAFTLDATPRGAARARIWTHTRSTTPDEIVILEQPMTWDGRPLTVVGARVIEGEAARDLTTDTQTVATSARFEIRFDATLDPAQQVPARLVDLANGTAVAVTTAIEGDRILITPAAGLPPAATLQLNLDRGLRAQSGALLGRSYSWRVSTAATTGEAAIDATKIRITIPESGVSQVRAMAGALPARWLAVVSRPVRDFITVPQAMAAADGALTITAGATSGSDYIDLTDRLQLRILNENGALAAVLPLGPFTSSDGLGFVALPGEEVTYETPEGVRLTVPASAFDEPVVVRADKNVQAEEFSAVPSFASELTLLESVRLSFECRQETAGTCEARTRLELSLTHEAAVDASQGPLLLGWLGQSTRGPRVMIVDTLVESSGRLETGDGQSSRAHARLQSNASGSLVRPHLQGVLRSGVYSLLDLNTTSPYGFAVLSASVGSLELFLSQESLFVTQMHRFESGRIAVPVVADAPFFVEGVDTTTGFTWFRRDYEPLPLPAGGTADINDPDTDLSGPYPMASSAARIDAVLLSNHETERPSFTATYEDQRLRVEFDGESHSAQVLLPSLGQGAEASLVGGKGTLSFDSVPPTAQAIVIMPSGPVAADQPIWIQFNEAVSKETLHASLVIRSAPSNATADTKAIDVTSLFEVSPDDSGRTILIKPRAGLLVPSTRYRIEIAESLTDMTGNPLGRGQTTPAGDEEPQPLGGPQHVVLEFETRTAQDEIAKFSLRPSELEQTGNLRDLAQLGNIAFVAAGSAGLLAYDLSDTSSLMREDGDPLPMALVPADRMIQNADGTTTVIRRGLKEHTAVTTDRHGRVITAGLTDTFAVLRTYSIEDFLTASESSTCKPELQAPGNGLCTFRGSSFIGWAPGFSSSLGDTTLLSDRAEGLPRRLRVLSQDDERPYTAATLRDTFTVHQRRTYPDGFEELDVEIEYLPSDPATAHAFQRVTIENLDLDMRWSGDLQAHTSGQMVRGVLVRPGDRLNVIRNRTTWVVVTLFGHGAVVYDLNAIESNDQADRPVGFTALREQLVQGRVDDACATLPILGACSADLSFTPEIVPVPTLSSAATMLHAPEIRKGIATAQLTSRDDGAVDLTGLPLHSLHDADENKFTNPRLEALSLAGLSRGIPIRPRFIGAEHVRINRKSFLLIAADRLGLLAFDVSSPDLSEAPLAGVLWVPSGVVGVRGIPGTSFVTLVDNSGRVLIANISGIDERDSGLPIDQPFPTALAALQSGTGAGVDDPRIIWRSAEGFVTGTLPPLVDPGSGLIFGGSTGTAEMKLGIAFEPRLRVVANLGRPQLNETDFVIPLGVAPPDGGLTPRADDASAAAFRVETNLPAGAGGAAEIELMVDSEIVEGNLAAEVDGALPRAHLRTDGRRPARVVMRSAVPQGTTPEETEALARRLRHQRGANRFVSSWIVAVADPRASEEFNWGSVDFAGRAALACQFCERPPILKGRNESSGVHEIYSAGRFFSLSARVPPALQSSFGAALQTRVRTVMADTIRIPEVQVAGQDPPLIGGTIQGAIYAHSGELEVPVVDLDAGGRAGWNVVIDRTYRSRSIGMTPLGYGWTSSMFRRLREMPDGAVEYRDEAGETWLFEGNRLHYRNARGLMLRLARGADNWTLVDPLQRLMVFDDYGRLTKETDHFWMPSLDGKEYGNTTRYVYGRDGRLKFIVDAVGRETELFYYEDGVHRGLLREVRDWRGRSVQYQYEKGRLTLVSLPEVEAGPGVPEQYAHTGANRPRIRYAYAPTPASYTDAVDLGANLISITDPNQVAEGGPARVAWTYGPAGDKGKRDRITEEIWPCGTTAGGGCREAKASIDWGIGANVVDILGQRTMYRTAEGPDRRHHIDEMKMFAVPVVEVGEAQVPLTITPTARDLTTTVTARNNFGQSQVTTDPDGSVQEIGYGVTTGVIVVPRPSAIRWAGADGETRESILAYGAHPLQPVSITRNGQIRQMAAPYRETEHVVIADDEISTTMHFDENGRTTGQIVTSGAGGGIRTEPVRYPDHDAVLLRRGLLRESRIGSVPTEHLEYQPRGNGILVTRRTDDGAILYVHTDGYGRPVEVRLEQHGNVLQHERLGYDASGNSVFRSRHQQGIGWVEEHSVVDPIGRIEESSMSGAMIEGQSATLLTSTAWDLENRMVISTGPAVARGGGPRTATTLDPLGRTTSTVTTAGDQVLQRFAGYDIRGSGSWTSDGVRSATVTTSDSLGRPSQQRGRDGLSVEWSYDQWDQPIRELTLSSAGVVIGASAMSYTDQGAVRTSTALIDLNDLESGRSLTSHVSWPQAQEGGLLEQTDLGASVGLDGELNGDEPLRISRRLIDADGRTVLAESGSALRGSSSLDRVVSRARFGDFIGNVPRTMTAEQPLAGVSYVSRQMQDALGRTTQGLHPGDYLLLQRFDEAGNMLGVTAPGMREATASFDSRGLAREQRHPDGEAIGTTWDALGSLKGYYDESGQATLYERDGLGRSTVTLYPDSTTEEVRHEPGSGRVLATKDRAGQWLSYEYDGGGRILKIYAAETPASESVLVSYTYDDGGRLTSVRNAHAELRFEDFDGMGRPQINRSIILGDDGNVAEQYVQAHRWNVFGEIERWSMPVVGEALPTLPLGNGWRTFIHQTWDAAGNLLNQRDATSMDSTPEGQFIMQASSRGPGLLTERRVAGLTTAWSYDDGSALPEVPGFSPELAPRARRSGALRSVLTSTNESVLAGSVAGYDATTRLSSRLDLASATRFSAWAYDERGRLRDTVLLTDVEGAGPGFHSPANAADVVLSRDTQPVFTEVELAKLENAGVTIGRLPWTAQEAAAHQLTAVTLRDGTHSFTWEGARRTSDGRWRYSWDLLGRLSAVEAIDRNRRVEYQYDPLGRVVRRTALRAEGEGWVAEDRPAVLAQDGMPARTTFVWDPVTDRLVSMFASAAAHNGAEGPDARLLRQYVHGDRGYDDPIEMVVTEAPSLAPKRVYPLVDWLGGGSVEAVADANGTLVERVLYADAYGAEPRYLLGLVIDRLELEIEKSGSGDLAEVRVRAHASDRLSASLMQGLQVRAVSSDGSSIPLVGTTVVDEADPFAAILTIAAPEWHSKAAGASRIELVVLDSLTSRTWAHAPPQPAPVWARELRNARSEPGRPIIIAESPLSIAERIASTPAGAATTHTLYEIPDLYFAGSEHSRAKLLTNFKTAPFSEPATGATYLRARWYYAGTGTFISPDPLGYVDGSNQYAFAEGDPVNLSDPLGLESVGIYGRHRDLRSLDPLGRDIEWMNRRESERAFETILSNPYVQGTLQVAGGCSEAGLGIAGVFTGVAAVPGAVAALHGSDICFTGFATLLTGEVKESLFVRGSIAGLQAAGVRESEARWITAAVDVSLGLYGTAATGTRLVALGNAPSDPGAIIKWIDEGGDLRATPPRYGMPPRAYEFQSATYGARSNALTGRSQAPYLEFIDEAGNVVGAKFDGVRGRELIDRKMNPVFSSKAVDQAARQTAVAHHYGLTAVWEFPDQRAFEAGRRFMEVNKIEGIHVRLAK